MRSRLIVAGGLFAAVIALGTGGGGFVRTGMAAPRPLGVITLAPTADLQSALEQAQPGDTITLPSGATYTGPFFLPRKDGDAWITIRSDVFARTPIPAPGTVPVARARPTGLPKLVAASGSVLTASAGAHHYRFVGLEFAPTPRTALLNLIDLGSAASTLDAVPHDLAFQQCYVHGDPVAGSRRGIALNSASTSITDSYFEDFKEVGADSQAIAGWNGPGPFTIVNNHLEGAGENVLFGGADPLIEGLVPSDITIQRNQFVKPLTWRQGDPQYAGTPWTVKNLLELKNARRVMITGNVFMYNWPQAQNGFSILFTVRNQDGQAPWSTIEDVQFVSNVVRHVAAGVNLLGHDDVNVSQQTRRVLIKNNVFTDVGGQWGSGLLFQLLNGTADVTIDHNTADQTATALLIDGPATHTGFAFENNVVEHNQYGIIGSGSGIGTSSIDHYLPGGIVRGDVLAGGNPALYPLGNFFPASFSDIGFVDLAGGDFGLRPGAPFKGKATDGTDPGVDMAALQTALAPVGTVDARPRASAAPVVLFWASLATLVYAYAGYGVLMWFWATVRPRPTRRAPIRPTVTVVIVAFNEAANIARRLENLMALDYPADRLEIVVASDGSTDDTVARATACPRARVLAFRCRRGKAAVLNDVVPSARGDIVVLADARQWFDRRAIAALVEPFEDETVGAVSGELRLVRDGEADGAAEGTAVYWSVEKLIRWSESRVDSSIGATGAIYAIRRSLFEPLAPDTLIDDVVIPLRIARAGRRVVFEPAACAFDRVMGTARQEFTRKVRTIAGTFQLFARERWLLDPWRNRLWLQTVSHKGLRLILPALYVVLFLANAALVSRGALYAWTMAGQVLFYVAAITGWRWSAPGHRPAIFVLPYTVCFLTWATIVGFARYISGRQLAAWERAIT